MDIKEKLIELTKEINEIDERIEKLKDQFNHQEVPIFCDSANYHFERQLTNLINKRAELNEQREELLNDE